VDILEFLAKSEWPLVVGGALWLLRRPISEMIDRLDPTKVDVLGFKAEFARRLEKVNLLTPPLVKPANLVQPKSFLAMDEQISKPQVTRIAPIKQSVTSPDAIVLLAWRNLESTMRSLSDAKRPKIGKLWTPPLRIEEAAKELGLSQDEVQALLELRQLRNKVAHSSDAPVSEDEAAQFREATERLLYRLIEEGNKDQTRDGEPPTG
jgi:hypothetical protein